MGGRRVRTKVIAAVVVCVAPNMIVAATSAASAVPSPQVAQGAQAASAPVRIGFDGSAFVPAVTRVTPGTTIEFTNDGSDVLAISDAADQFDLSPIPAGGGSAIVLPSGTYEFADLTSGARGRVLIGTATFGGSPTDPVGTHRRVRAPSPSDRRAGG